MPALLRCELASHHDPSGQGNNLIDPLAPRSIPPAAVLEIVQYEGDSSFFLLSISADGSCSSDTWHPSLDDAKHQAEYQYGVQKDEWIAAG